MGKKRGRGMPSALLPEGQFMVVTWKGGHDVSWQGD
jgi:hypothetical protein